MKATLIAASGMMLFVASGTLSATPITFTGTGGSLAASAVFSDSGGNLQVTLTNTSTADVLVPSNVLTAVFFDTNVPITLTKVSATVPAGSSVLFGTTDPGGVVGGEWAYRSGLSGTPGNQGYGISSTGLNWFGPGDVFPGTNLQGPASPDGIQYGLTSAGDNPLTGNTPVTGTNALIKNQVVFVLSGLPAGLDASKAISNVYFLYGTSLGEGGFTGTPRPVVPEPTAAALVLVGGLAAFRRRIRVG